MPRLSQCSDPGDPAGRLHGYPFPPLVIEWGGIRAIALLLAYYKMWVEKISALKLADGSFRLNRKLLVCIVFFLNSIPFLLLLTASSASL